jgi:hypothetical protein
MRTKWSVLAGCVAAAIICASVVAACAGCGGSTAPRDVVNNEGLAGCMTVVAVPDWPMKDGRTCRGPWEAGLERPIRRM